MVLISSLLKTVVYHKRFTPSKHAFCHHVFYMNLNCKDFIKPPNLRFFSLNRFNLLSIFLKDYGFETLSSPTEYIASTLTKFDLDPSLITNITLITLPKIFGYAFNPVSFWLCFDEKDQLRCVLVEVNNTFGDRHAYLCYRSDFLTITANDTLYHKKVFHVSPFCQVVGDYQFKFDIDSAKVYIAIDYFKNGEKILTTSIFGKRIALNDKNVLHCFFIYPFMLFKVMFLIHYHAFRLWIKNVPYFKKPSKPTVDIT